MAKVEAVTITMPQSLARIERGVMPVPSKGQLWKVIRELQEPTVFEIHLIKEDSF